MTGWVSRTERHFHGAMSAADVTGASLVEVVDALLRLPRGTAVELRP